LAYFAVKNFSTRFGNGRILPQIMEAIGITLVCVAVLVVPALLLSRRQRNGLRRLRRDADGGFWFPGGHDFNARTQRRRRRLTIITIPVQADIMAVDLTVAGITAAADMAGIEPRTTRKTRTQSDTNSTDFHRLNPNPC
jgi:hypothetical protein